MSEEVKDLELSLEDLFAQSQETFEQATTRATEESKTFSKTKRFKMDKYDTYTIRILPLCPDSTRKGYEFPMRAMLLKLENPKDAKKPIYVSVCNAKQAGLSVDLIDVYKDAAISALKAQGDDEGAKKINDGGFGGGLKWDYQHAMYVVDMKNKKEGIQLAQLSHAQFKDLDERKLKLWDKLLKKNPKHGCPISSIINAFPVEIEKKKDNTKTVYAINIDNVSDYEPLEQADLKGLLDAPRVNDVVYRYVKYHLEATIEFLKQYDERMGIKVMSDSQEVKDAITKIKLELPADDTSSFSYDKKDKDGAASQEGESTTLTLDDLFNRFDELAKQKLGDKTEEGQELRDMIRQYIEEQNLSAKIRIGRTKTTSMLLEEIEAELEKQGGESSVKSGSNDTEIGDDEGSQPEEEPEEEKAPVVEPSKATRAPRGRRQ